MTMMMKRTALALLPLVFISPGVRALVESRMSAHMLLQFPLLFAAGWAAAVWLPGRSRPAAVDALGLASATWASAVLAFWMLPVALDLALLNPVMAGLKYATWWNAGLLLARGWPRLAVELKVFFLGNAAWMTATAGLLYRETETRLCVSYRYDEQVWTGTGLVVWACALGALAAALLLRGEVSREPAAEAAASAQRRTDRASRRASRSLR